MVKRNTEFPKVKGLYKKRTAAGVRYVLRGTKKDGGKMVDLFVTVPLDPDDSDRVFYEKVQKAREELDAKINPVKDIAYYIDQYACKRTLWGCKLFCVNSQTSTQVCYKDTCLSAKELRHGRT